MFDNNWKILVLIYYSYDFLYNCLIKYYYISKNIIYIINISKAIHIIIYDDMIAI